MIFRFTYDIIKNESKTKGEMPKMTVGIDKRRDEIMEMVRENGSVRVAQISRIYGVSEVTVRGDLEYLEAQGVLTRVHGGAVGTGKHYINMDMSDRYMSNSSSKKELAQKIASLIENNDTGVGDYIIGYNVVSILTQTKCFHLFCIYLEQRHLSLDILL